MQFPDRNQTKPNSLYFSPCQFYKSNPVLWSMVPGKQGVDIQKF